jgi:ribose 5-phosphate isomerase B
MRTAIDSDESSELTDALIAELEERGHEIVAFGPIANEEESDWPLVRCGSGMGRWKARKPASSLASCWS